MMESKGDWIAPLVQRCSSFYLEGRGDADLVLEDDGSNLRFTNPGIPRSAVIYQVRASLALSKAYHTDYICFLSVPKPKGTARTDFEFDRREDPD